MVFGYIMGKKHWKRNPIMTEKKRIQIDLVGDALKQLESLKLASGSTNATVLRNALKLYQFVKQEEQEGGKLIVEGKHGKKQIIIP